MSVWWTSSSVKYLCCISGCFCEFPYACIFRYHSVWFVCLLVCSIFPLCALVSSCSTVVSHLFIYSSTTQVCEWRRQQNPVDRLLCCLILCGGRTQSIPIVWVLYSPQSCNPCLCICITLTLTRSQSMTFNSCCIPSFPDCIFINTIELKIIHTCEQI